MDGQERHEGSVDQEFLARGEEDFSRRARRSTSQGQGIAGSRFPRHGGAFDTGRTRLRGNEREELIALLRRNADHAPGMDELLQRGIRLFNQREFFRCHEALEEAWKPERGPRRLFLQALIHLAVGFYHCQRGNPVGADRQLRKGLKKLAAYLPSCEGIDTARLYQESGEALERIEAAVPRSTYPQIHTLSAAGSKQTGV